MISDNIHTVYIYIQYIDSPLTNFLTGRHFHIFRPHPSHHDRPWHIPTAGIRGGSAVGAAAATGTESTAEFVAAVSGSSAGHRVAGADLGLSMAPGQLFGTEWHKIHIMKYMNMYLTCSYIYIHV